MKFRSVYVNGYTYAAASQDGGFWGCYAV